MVRLFNSVRSWLERHPQVSWTLFNFVAYLLPALYQTLSMIWVAQIDSSSVQLLSTYQYIETINEVITEAGRSCYNVIGDSTNRTKTHRFQLCTTLLSVLSVFSLVVCIVIVGAAESFVQTFVNGPEHTTAVAYVRIQAMATWLQTIETVMVGCMRSLGYFNIPMVISLVKTLLNIILDLALLSTVRVSWIHPTAVTQVWIKFGCGVAAVLCGLIYLGVVMYRVLPSTNTSATSAMSTGNEEADQLLVVDASGCQPRRPWFPDLRDIRVLFSATIYCCLESVYRNFWYLILMNKVVQVSPKYATAYGAFTTIRWGVIMVPNLTAESVVEVRVSERWGSLRDAITTFHPQHRKPRAHMTTNQLWYVYNACLYAATGTVIVEGVLEATSSKWVHAYAMLLQRSCHRQTHQHNV